MAMGRVSTFPVPTRLQNTEHATHRVGKPVAHGVAEVGNGWKELTYGGMSVGANSFALSVSSSVTVAAGVDGYRFAQPILHNGNKGSVTFAGQRPSSRLYQWGLD